MQLAIIHFHLNRGGVTQVIVSHLRALASLQTGREIERVVVFFGGRQEAWPYEAQTAWDGLHVTLCAVPELEYDCAVRGVPGAIGASAESVIWCVRTGGR